MNDVFYLSWTKYDKNMNDPKANGAKFKYTSFAALEPTDDKEKCRAQFYKSPNRVVIENINWEDWTNVTYIDIDSKHWYKDGGQTINEQKLKDVPILILYGSIYNWLTAHYLHNINDAELSRSQLGFHFYFKWDCEKSEEARIYYNEVARAIVYKAFCECGYKEIIDYPQVYDNCTTSYYQLVYPTKIHWLHNRKCDGKLTYYEDLNIDESKIIKKKNKELKNKLENATGFKTSRKGNYEFVLRNKFDVAKVDYIVHAERWSLFESLKSIFKDEDELRKEWERCCVLIPNCNGHSTEFYFNEPYKQNQSYTWENLYDTDCYCDIKLLKKFGYEVECIKISSNINDIFSNIFINKTNNI